MARYRHPTVKTAIDKRCHRYGLGYHRPVIKKSAIGMTVSFWDKNYKIITAKNEKHEPPKYGNDDDALLDNGEIIGVGTLVGVY